MPDTPRWLKESVGGYNLVFRKNFDELIEVAEDSRKWGITDVCTWQSGTMYPRFLDRDDYSHYRIGMGVEALGGLQRLRQANEKARASGTATTVLFCIRLFNSATLDEELKEKYGLLFSSLIHPTVYLGSNGSEAVETALKLARQYHRQSYTRDGIGQDNVLYSDGHVERRNGPRSFAPTELRACWSHRSHKNGQATNGLYDRGTAGHVGHHGSALCPAFQEARTKKGP
jgi:hypothetical protein